MSLSELREARLELAGWSCEWPSCSSRDGLQLCHLTPKGIGGTHGVRAEWVNSLANVVILCHYHHMIQEGETTQGRKREVTELLRAYVFEIHGNH